MAKNYKHSGRTVRATAGAARSAGNPVREDNWCGVIEDDAANGAEYVLNVEGVYELTVPSGVAKGDVVYIETTGMTLTKTTTGNYIFGRAVTARNATSGKAWIKIIQPETNAAAA